MKNPSVLKIGQASKALGVSIDTLRRWEASGKINAERTAGGTRVYSPFVKIGEAAKVLGVSIDTLRRWERAGKIAPVRTPGSTRLYSLEELKKLTPTSDFRLPTSENPSTTELLQKKEVPQLPKEDYQHFSHPIALETLIKQKIDDRFENLVEPISKPKKIYAKIYAGAALCLILVLLFLLIGPISLIRQMGLMDEKPKAKSEQPVVSDVLAASSIAEIGKFLEINADTVITGNLAVDGESIFGEGITGKSTLSIAGVSTLSTTSVNSSLSVTGLSTLTGGLTTPGKVTLTGNAAETMLIKPASDPSSTTKLFVIKNAADSEKVSIDSSGATILSSTLKVSGATTLSSTISVSGATTLSSSLEVSGTTTLSGAIIGSSAGAASTPGLKLTGAWYTGGSATTTKPQFLIEPTDTTSTGWSASGTGIGVNAKSAFTGNLIDLQVAGTSKFKVDYSGNYTSTGVFLAADGTVSAPAYSFSADTDTGIYRSASNTLDFSSGGVRTLTLATATSGVNYISITPAATGSGPTIASAGSDTNIPLTINSVLTGALTLDSTSTGTVNLGTGNSGKTINVGTGTGADTINIGTGGTGADTITLGSSASTTSLALTSGTGSQTFTSNVVTGTTTTSGFVFDATAISSGTGLYLVSDSVTTGRMLDIATSGNTWTGNGTTNGLVNLASTSTAGTASSSDILLNIARSGANANATHTAYGLYSNVTNTGTTNTNVAGYFSATGAVTNRGLEVAAMTGATSTGLTVGALSGTTANTGINIGAISGASATGAGLTVGNISTTGTTNYGLQLGTMTGGTTSNYQISTGVLTSATTTTNAQINLGGVVTTGGTTNYGINVGALSGSGTTNYGINITALTSTGTTNTAFNIGGLSGAGTNNYGIQIQPVTGAGTANVALCFDCDGTYSASTVASGIQFGTDANAVSLYRSANDVLRTGDSLTVDLDLIVSGGDITGTGDESIDIGEATANGITLLIDAAGEVLLTSSALSPSTSDGNALGTTALMWADLFLANGGVINFDNGDITLTHATDSLTVGSTAGATALAFNSGTGAQTFTSNVVSGTTTTSGFVFDATAITSGTGLHLVSDSVTTGRMLDIATSGNTWTGNGTTNGLVNLASTSTAGTASSSDILLNIARSGANANTAHTAYGIYSNVTNTNATSGTNIAGYFSASGATTANYGLIVENGRVGIGTATPTGSLLVVGGGIKVTANIPGSDTASAGYIDYFSGNVRFFAQGTDTSTRGGYQFTIRTSNEGSETRVLTILNDGNVGIGTTAAPDANLDIDGGARTVTAVSQRAFINNTNAITTNTGATAVYGLTIDEPNITVGTATPTNSASLYISGAATEASNNYALWVDAGTSAFGGSIVPDASDGAALGTTALMWSDLFLASGSVINFNNGDVTLTHATDALTLAGGVFVAPDGTASAPSITFTGDTDTGLFHSANLLRLTAGGAEAIRIDQANLDFYQTAPNNGAYYVQFTPANLTGITGEKDFTLYNGATFTITGSYANQRFHQYNRSNITAASALTVTNAATFYLSGATNAAGSALITNSYSLLVDGVAGLSSNISNLYGIYVGASTGPGSIYGVGIAAQGTATLWLSADTDSTSAAGGITFGSSKDTNLYRSAANTLTTDDAFSAAGVTVAANSNLTLSSGTGVYSQTFTGTTTDAFTITGSSITTGSAIVATGPTSTGVTDHFLKLTSDIGSAAALIYGAPDFSGSAVTGYGLNITATDATANANTDYAGYLSLALTGNAAKTGYGLYSTVTSSSTTADTTYGGYFTTSTSGAVASGTQSTYGLYSTATSSNVAGGTENVYAHYTKAGGTVASGTINAYGLYVANGTMNTTGTSTNYGVYLENMTAADTNYSLYSAGIVYSAPVSPQYIAGLENGASGAGDGVNGVFVQGRYLYSVKANNTGTCDSSTRTGCEFQIYDFSNPSSPTYMGGADIGKAATDIFVSGRYAYVGRGGTAGACDASTSTGCEILIYDISDPTSPAFTGGIALSNAASPSGVNSIYAAGRYLYFGIDDQGQGGTCAAAGSDFGCSLQIWDISNPANPFFVGGASVRGTGTTGANNGGSVKVQGKYAYLARVNAKTGTCSSSDRTGCDLMIFDISNPAAPVYKGGIDNGDFDPGPVQVSGRYAYLVTYSDLRVFDIGNPASPSLAATIATSQGYTIALAGRYLYYASNDSSLKIYDVGNPASPTLTSTTTIGGSSYRGLAVAGRYAFVSIFGNTGTCSSTTATGCEIQIYDLGGFEGGSVVANALEAGSLQVRENANIFGNAYINGGLDVGTNGIQSLGGISSLGDMLIGKQTDSGGATTNWVLQSQTTAGTIAASGTTLIDGVSSTAVYNGSLYAGTSEANATEIYRLDGSRGWTRVSQTTAGTIASAGTASIDETSAMAVYDGYLYVGTNEANSAEVYRYDGSTTWTRVSQTTAGTIASAGTASIDKVTAMAVYQGKLYIGTSESNSAEVYRYDGGTTWTKVSNGTGTIASGGTASIDGVVSMTVFNGRLYAGTNEANSAEVYRYDGGTGWTKVSNGTAGTIAASGTASIDQVTAMTVYLDRLYIGTNEANSAEVYMYDDSNGSTTWFKVSQAAGTIAASGTASIDGVASMTIYNGRLYVGTTEANSAEAYIYGNGTTWTRVTQSTAGTIAASGTASIDTIATLIPYNLSLYAGTNEANSAEVYFYDAIEGQSFALKFNGASDNANAEQSSNMNIGSISFLGEQQANNYTGMAQTGSFMFSHGITTAFGAYDIAEDYPTRDESLQAGDLVAIDEGETGFVKKANGQYSSKMLGIYSEKPALRLSQQGENQNGGKMIPVALAGRVPVKVSTENGPIEKGDYLTSSSTPGVAMSACAKATADKKGLCKPGQMVGKALEAYNNEGINKILAFVNVSWADPGQALANLLLDEQGNLVIPKVKTASLEIGPIGQISPIGQEQESALDVASKLKVIDEQIATQSATLAELGTKIKDLEASASASLNLTPPEILLATGSATLANIKATETLSSEKLLTALDVNISGVFKALGESFLGNTLIAGDLIVDGTFSISRNSINAIEILYLQNNSLAQGLDILNGKFIFDKTGKLTVAGTVEAEQFSVTSGKSAGTAKILAGQTEIAVENPLVKSNSVILVTPKETLGQTLAVVEKTEGQSFTVSLSQTETKDINFDYLIIGVNND